jgi:hypothetical protein
MIIAMENFIPDRCAVSAQKKSDPALAPGSVAEASPNPGPGQSTVANRSTRPETPVPYVPLLTSVPDLGVDFSPRKTPLNPFVRPR